MDSQAQSERALIKTAYHEAGHAVAAVFLGTRLDYVTILPHDHLHGRSRGETKISDEMDKPAQRYRNQWIGIFHDLIRIASARHSQAQFARLSKSDEAGFHSDNESIDAFSDSLFKSDKAAAARTVAAARDVAKKLMSSPHGQVAVKAVAHKLQQYKSLRGDEVVEVVESAPHFHFQQNQEVKEMVFKWEVHRSPFTPVG